ncbi:GGDEF domain-containing protein [Marinobacteraceae bacterium S3BR75-40.1]
MKQGSVRSHLSHWPEKMTSRLWPVIRTVMPGENETDKADLDAEMQSTEAFPETTAQKVLHSLTGHFFEKETAEGHWSALNHHRNQLKETLGRDVGFAVAALDYFENIRPLKAMHYTIVEQSYLQSLVQRSSIDAKTRLYNHQTFMLLLQKELAQAKRTGQPLTLLMVDIDNFKQINDTLGHPEGDKVLSRVAQVLQRSLRAMDIAGRYGGEEFILALPETASKDGQDIAERIRRRVEHMCAQKPDVTVSIGVASFPETSQQVKGLICAADYALLEAKQRGKNRTCCRCHSKHESKLKQA